MRSRGGIGAYFDDGAAACCGRVASALDDVLSCKVPVAPAEVADLVESEEVQLCTN